MPRGLLPIYEVVIGLAVVLCPCSMTQVIPDAIHLVNEEMSACMTAVDNLAYLLPCNESDPLQKWRWISDMVLQNVATSKCLTGYLELDECSVTPSLVCSFNVLRNAFSSYFVSLWPEYDRIILSPHANEYSRWKALHDESFPICNVTSFKGRRHWRQIGHDIRRLTTGLNAAIIGESNGNTLGRFNSTGQMHTFDGHAPFGLSTGANLWVIGNDGHMYWKKMGENWIHVAAPFPVTFIDYSLPNRGYTVFNDIFHFRTGITPAEPRGTDWLPGPDVRSIQALACGVTTCFAIIDGAVHYRTDLNAANPTGSGWQPVPNQLPHQVAQLGAGPPYELWVINTFHMVYRRVGISDVDMLGTHWERVPDILLSRIDIGIYGPVGISPEGSQLLIMSGNPTVRRQRELDTLCGDGLCPATVECGTSGNQCYVRFRENSKWACFHQLALQWDGMAGKLGEKCFFTSDSQLKEVAYKTPVLGDFEIQQRLDLQCNNVTVNNEVRQCRLGCLHELKYSAVYDADQSQFKCVRKCKYRSCASKHVADHFMLPHIQGSCTDTPLLSTGHLGQTIYGGGGNEPANFPSGDNYIYVTKRSMEVRYLEIDFRFLHKICAVAITSESQHLLASYTIKYSSNRAAWRYVSIHGDTHVFSGPAADGETLKHYLPAFIEARYLRLYFEPVNAEARITGDIYGSSKEFDAESCDYYREELFATVDGFYYIYVPENGTKYRTYCSGFDKGGPLKSERLHEDFKMSWPLNASTAGVAAFTSQGRTGAKLNGKVLGDFYRTCFVDPMSCDRGITLELWLWYSCSVAAEPVVVLESNWGLRRGYSIRVHKQEVCFRVRGYRKTWTACVANVGNSQRWLHVVASWGLPKENSYAIIVDDPATATKSEIESIHSKYRYLKASLKLPLYTPTEATNCTLAVSSLTMWPWQLADDEIQELFKNAYHLSGPGQSCTALCETKGAACHPVIAMDVQNAFRHVGINCTLGQAAVGNDVAPFADSQGNCFAGSTSSFCCDCSHATSRRLCRCEKPIDGKPSEWSFWSLCSRTCGRGKKVRSRKCSNPGPKFGGAPCREPLTETIDCVKPSCHGNQGVLQTLKADSSNLQWLYRSLVATLLIQRELSPTVGWSREFYDFFFHPPLNGSYQFIFTCTGRCIVRVKRSHHSTLSSFYSVERSETMWESNTTRLLTLNKDQPYMFHVNLISKHQDSFFGMGCIFPNGEQHIPLSGRLLSWKLDDPRGVLRDIWSDAYGEHGVKYLDHATQHNSSNFEPQHADSIDVFQTDMNFAEGYMQRLRTFFLVPTDGTYHFLLACTHVCGLWANDNVTEALRIKEAITHANAQTSAHDFEIDLIAGTFVRLEVLHVGMSRGSYVILGVRLPNGATHFPIPKIYLWKKVPANIALGRSCLQKNVVYNKFATLAVDGDASTFTHTRELGINPYWRANFHHRTRVLIVAVTNRGWLGHRLNGFVVNAGGVTCDAPYSIPLAGTGVVICGNEGSIIDVNGYLEIRLDGFNRVLSLAEVVMYGYIDKEIIDDPPELGIVDGRVEDYQFNASSSRVAHEPHDARMFAQWKKWVGNQDDAVPRFEVTFKEAIYVQAIATADGFGCGAAEYKVEALVGNTWVVVKTAGGYEIFGKTSRTSTTWPYFKKFQNQTLLAKKIAVVIVEWRNYPCLSLALFGKILDNVYTWDLDEFRNTIATGVSEELLQATDEPNHSTIPITLHGLNSDCLENPKECGGRFEISLEISLRSPADQGYILTTNNYNRTAVGTSILVEDGELAVLVHTQSRKWDARLPIASAIASFCSVQVKWDYDSPLELEVCGSSITNDFVIVEEPVNLAQNTSIVVGGDGLDFDIASFKIKHIDLNEDQIISRRLSVDGIMSPWSQWSYCSRSCGSDGVQSRSRFCDNPVASFNGSKGPGVETVTRGCVLAPCEERDGVLREVWLNKDPATVLFATAFDGFASHQEFISNFSCMDDYHKNYVQRLRAFISVSESGDYDLQLSCSYKCELWLSSDDDSNNKLMVLSIDESGTPNPTSRTLSSTRRFSVGQACYVEVKTFEIESVKETPLLTVFRSGTTSVDHSFIRHKPDNYHGLGLESGAIHAGYMRMIPQRGPVTDIPRLNGVRPYCTLPFRRDRFQFSFFDYHWVSGVLVQGYGTEYLRTLYISTSLDSSIYFYMGTLEYGKYFDANQDSVSTVYIEFPSPMRALYLIFHNRRQNGCVRIEVIGKYADNVAYQKPVTDSSPLLVAGSPLNALTDARAAETVFSSMATINTTDPFVTIDLGKAYYITEVWIIQMYSRRKETQDVMEVRVGNSTSWTDNGPCDGHMYNADSDNYTTVAECDGYLHGRYVTVLKIGAAEELSLAEVSVFQLENDTVMSNWSSCSVTCGEGFEYRYSICIKPYYCQEITETRACVQENCKIRMRNCRELLLQGYNTTGVYILQGNGSTTNFAYCDQDYEVGGWLVIQRRNRHGDGHFNRSWYSYATGFGNVSANFWYGNENLHQLTKDTSYEFLVHTTHSDGTVQVTRCDIFNVSSSTEFYQLELETCVGPEAEALAMANSKRFSTVDSGVPSSVCGDQLSGGWWYDGCGSLVQDGFATLCSVSGLCDEITIMIRPLKVDGGWSHWTDWEVCDKPCGNGNKTRTRSCTHPPPSENGEYCRGAWNDSTGCNTHACRGVYVNLTLRFTEEIWSPELQNPHSALRHDLEQKINNNVQDLYQNYINVTTIFYWFRQGSVMSDFGIFFEASDLQQFVVIQEDLDQDGLLNQNMPVVYSYSEITVSDFLVATPEIVHAQNTSSQSILVQWSPPNITSPTAGTVAGYHLYYRESDDDSSLEMLRLSVPSGILELELEDLEIFTNYSFRICAFSDDGNGLPSAPYIALTDEHVPDRAPEITNLTNTSSTSLYVAWQQLDEVHFRGYPLGYTLYYKEKYDSFIYNISIDDYTTTNLNITGLKKYTEYQVTVVAKTIKGEGSVGIIENTTTDEDVPSVPPSNISVFATTSTSLLVNWVAVPSPFLHGVLTGHLIYYWPIDDANETMNVTAEPLARSITLDDLRKYTNYSITVAAMTSKGPGNESGVVEQTLDDIPERNPLNLKVANVTSTSLNITWEHISPDFVPGILLGYNIYYEETFGDSGNLTVPWYQTYCLLTGFDTWSNYNVTVTGFTRVGEGPRSSLLRRTSDGAPSRAPWDFACPSVSSYTIFIEWFPFTPEHTGNELDGYSVTYRMIEPLVSQPSTFTVAPFAKFYTLENLRAFTSYAIDIFVYNSFGRSNVSSIVCKTDEGVPLAYPANVRVSSRYSPSIIKVEWEKVEDIDVAGIRKGYTIIYRRVNAYQQDVREEENEHVIFDPERTDFHLANLDTFSIYSIQVLVFNNLFPSEPSPPVVGETCRCQSDFYVNWCDYKPYVNTSQHGIFPVLIPIIVHDVCGNCSTHEHRIHFDEVYDGQGLKKSSMVEVKNNIGDKYQINFPVLGRKDNAQTGLFTFLPVVASPGSVFVTKKPELSESVSYVLIDTVIATLPLFGFAVITAMAAGLIMWFLECGSNPEFFPRNVFRGSLEGFWWAFISMTTVGYGDRFPVTTSGRIFALLWVLYGLVITSLVISNLTAGLTALVTFSINKRELYQSNIAVLENTSEFRLGMAQGAFVNKARSYSSITTILHAVEVGSVEGTLLDMYVVSSLRELRRKNSTLHVNMIINNPSIYGVMLSGHAKRLQKPFSSYLKENAALVSQILEENTRPVKEDEEGGEEEETTPENEGSEINVLSSDSPIIHQPLMYSLIGLGVMVVVGLLLHFTLCKSLRRKGRRNLVSPISHNGEQFMEMKQNLHEFTTNIRRNAESLRRKHAAELARLESFCR